MPIICMFRGIKITINYNDHMPPHFHAYYGEYECCIDINEIEKITGDMPNKQLKMLLGWTAMHQEELQENWYLARQRQELFTIEPLRQVKSMIEPRVREYFDNPRKIIAVEPLENYVLQLTFDNGEIKCYSMQNKLQGVFSVLQNPVKFQKVFLDEFGNVAWDIDETKDSSVHWNNRIDLCKDALYLDSV